jgi:hypothetical protein
MDDSFAFAMEFWAKVGLFGVMLLLVNAVQPYAFGVGA